MDKNITLKPISFWVSLLMFGIPGVIIYYGIYYGAPVLYNNGVPLIVSIMVFMWVPTILLIPVSLILYKLEGNKMSLTTLKERFRFKPIQGKEWFWVIGIFIICIISDQSLEGIGKWAWLINGLLWASAFVHILGNAPIWILLIFGILGVGA